MHIKFFHKIKEKLSVIYYKIKHKIENYVSTRLFLFFINISAFIVFLLSLFLEVPILTIIMIILFFLTVFKLV